jgi:outer membrane immunogenic protein
MRRILFFVALTVLVFASMNAFAGNAYNWTGVYVGVEGSYSFGSADWKNVDDISTNNLDNMLTGGMGGLFLGFNYQTPVNIVVGVVTDMNGGELSASSACPNPSYMCKTELNWLGSTSVRIGYPFSRVLPYVGFGVAYTNAYLNGYNAFASISTKDFYFGLTPSIGVDIVIVKNLIGRAEWAYYDFRQKHVGFSDGEDADNKIQFNELKLGLYWKF